METRSYVALCLVIFFLNNAVLDLRTGHFRELVGFEAKDWSFEHKTLSYEAKDFKMSLQGQGRP